MVSLVLFVGWLYSWAAAARVAASSANSTEHDSKRGGSPTALALSTPCVHIGGRHTGQAQPCALSSHMCMQVQGGHVDEPSKGAHMGLQTCLTRRGTSEHSDNSYLVCKRRVFDHADIKALRHTGGGGHLVAPGAVGGACACKGHRECACRQTRMRSLARADKASAARTQGGQT